MDKKQILEFKKKIKSFKDMSKDMVNGLILAKELKKETQVFLDDDLIKNNISYKQDFLKIRDGLQIYIENVESLNKYTEKWKKK